MISNMDIHKMFNPCFKSGFLLLSVLISSVLCCSPHDGPDPLSYPPSQKAHLYDISFIGRVISKSPDNRFDYGSGSSVYTAGMEVYCSYKGKQLPDKVSVREAGYVPGHCYDNELNMNMEYIVLMDTSDDGPRLGMVLEATEANKRNFSHACGLELLRPKFGSGNYISKCPSPAREDFCEVQIPRTNHIPQGPPSPKGASRPTTHSTNGAPAPLKPGSSHGPPSSSGHGGGAGGAGTTSPVHLWMVIALVAAMMPLLPTFTETVV